MIDIFELWCLGIGFDVLIACEMEDASTATGEKVA